MLQYQQWSRQVNKALSPISMVTTADYPLINFRKLHRVGKTPTEAAHIAKAINPFIRQNKSPLHISLPQNTM